MSGQAWKYSDQLDDMDLKMMKRDFFTYKIGMKDVSVDTILYELKIGGTRNVYATDTERKRDGGHV